MHHTTLFYLPNIETVLVVYGYKVLSKRNEAGDTPLVTEVGIDLSTSLECFDHIPI